jgi:hypothetical protein
VVSILAEKHNIHVSYITTYPPSDTRAFNATRTTLHMSQKRIHVLRKRSQDIPRSPRPRCVVVTSRTTDTQPLLHNRDCFQTNLILRGWVQDSHHPVGGYLPSYLFIGASLQKSKLQKVKTESKSRLPPVKTTIVLI